MRNYLQTLTLVQVNGVDVIDSDSEDSDLQSVDTEPEPDSDDSDLKYESDSDSDSSDEDEPTPKKRGRKPLTQEEREISEILKKEYFKLYYLRNPDKYKYTKYDYSNSCVYKLTSPHSDTVYIGSTILPLNLRLKRHLSCIRHRKNSTYTAMFDKSLNWEIEPIIKVPLSSKKELDTLETIYISSSKDKLFNKNKKYSMEIIKLLISKYKFPNAYLPK